MLALPRCVPAWTAFLAAMSCVVPAAAQTASPGPGVPLELARERARLIRDLRYDLTLSIPAARSEPISGRNVVRFQWAGAGKPLVLDFDPDRSRPVEVRSNGKPVEVARANGHLVVAASDLRAGENTVEIGFEAGEAPLNRADDLLFTVFVPANARRALPCFDQPDLKARWTLTLEHPAPWLSVANGAELERHVAGDRVRVRFAETRPLPSYLVAFTAGALKMETAVRGGRAMRMFHRESDPARLQRNLAEIFDLHARSLDFMASYTGIDYPFDKFDFVLLPTFPFPAMEHAGSIAYSAEALLLDASATQEDRLERTHLIGHEVAHSWFGNLVTMRWFDDVWTKEVFANFMASKIADPLFPQVRHDLRFFRQHHFGAYSVDRSAGTHPIRQPLDNLADAASLYTAIIYQKAPVVMRQLESLIGETGFRDGLREYLKRHAFANATWDDLIDALAPRAGFDLRAWSRVWIDEPDRPTITTDLALREGKVERLRLRQSDPKGRGRLWQQQLRVTVLCAGGSRRLTADLVGPEIDLTAALGDCVPQLVLAGGEGWGYADFQLDERSSAFLVDGLVRLEDPLARSVAWSALWDAMLGGRLAPDRLRSIAVAALAQETDEQLTNELLGRMRTIWWRFMLPSERAASAESLEALLSRRLKEAPTAARKADWFRALRALAITPATVGWLHAIWRREIAVPGLPLEEQEEIALAMALAVRDVPDAGALVEAQIQRIADPDRRARLAFVRGALAGDPAERERWFRNLADPAKRRPETWVAEGMGLLHHPLRASVSAPLVPPALEMLLDLRRTGAPFFDAIWLSGLLDGHGSPEVAASVRRYLAATPADYPPRLRRLVLQSSDILERAARTRQR
jgi:aminopeptidase N